MRVRLTQIIDYWIGVPLCAVFSFLQLVQRLFGKDQPREPRKILFIEISEMGSAIIAYSALMKARAKVGAEDLYFLVFEKNRESVELLDIIPRENIITIPDESFLSFAIGAFSALSKVRSLGIDTVIDLELFSRFTALFSFASGAVNRAGFHNYTAEGLYRGTFITHRVFYNHHQHMAMNFLALVNSLFSGERALPMLKKNVGGDILPLPAYKVTEEQRSTVSGLLSAARPGSRFVVINPDPGEALPIRGWPVENFAEVARRIAGSDSSITLVVIGLKRSKPYADAISAAAGEGRVLDLTGRTKTLGEVLALLGMSELMLGNDSGPAHFAALTNIKIVTLFGPETPALYGPLSRNAVNIFSGFACAPCLSAANHRHSICRDNKCLKCIEPDDVAEKVMGLFESR